MYVELILSQTQLNILQVLLENYRASVIVKEFIITTSTEIRAALRSKANEMYHIKNGLSMYMFHLPESQISSSIMSLNLLICELPSEQPLIIGFGGLNATQRLYK